MNWNEIGTQLIIGILGILISAISVYATYLLNKFIKNKELKDILSSLNEVVKNAVLETYQVYVEELKDKNAFDKEAQKIALERALNTIKVNLPENVKAWLKSNFEDIEGYLKTLIEAQIGLLKNGGK